MDIFSLVGKMTIDGIDKSKQQLGDLEKKTQQVQKGLKVMGAAFTAVGVAGLAMVQSTKKINAQLGVTAHSLGISTKEMRALTLAVTNVTFPIDEVTASFDLLARAGVKDTEVLKSTATAFDTLGDAIGQSASEVTQVMVPAMKTFGLSAEEIASKTDMMTYMTRNSTTSLEDFNTMVGYTSQDMVAAGLTIDDMAAAMMYMSDNGVEPGKVMLREWNKAVTRSEKEGIALTKALGMTSAELETYKGNLAGATGLTQELADIQNEQYTIMDKVKAKFSELALGASGFLEPLEPVLAGMTALGPVMMALSTSAGTAAIKWAGHTVALVAHKVASFASAVAIKAVTAAQWLWNAAMTANPIGLIIVGIGALIAAGIVLWKNWDKVTDFLKKAWVNIKLVFLTGVENVLDSLTKFTGWIPFLGDKVQEAHDAIVGMIDSEKVMKAAEAIIKANDEMYAEVEERAEELTGVIREELEKRRDLELENLQSLKDIARKEHADQIEGLRKTYGVLEREDEQYQDTKLDAARRATDEMRKQYDRDIDAARDAYNEKIKLIDKEYSARLKLLDQETAAIISDYQRQIDAIDARTETEERKAEEAERVKRFAELKGAVESAETEEARLEAINELEEYQARIDRERLLESRRAEKEALRGQIEDTRRAAEQERDRLGEVLREKKTHEQALLDETTSRLEEEKVALDAALNAELIRIDNERIAFEEAETAKHAAKLQQIEDTEKALEAHYEKQLSDTELHVAAINAATAELQDKTVTITTVYRTVGGGGTGGGGTGGGTPPPAGGYTPPPELPDIYDPIFGYARGGVIPEPTLLTSLRTMRPYAIAGEKRKEYVTPGIPTININFNGDVHIKDESDMDEFAERFVARIRLRTGVKI